jgi:hypothetical protein
VNVANELNLTFQCRSKNDVTESVAIDSVRLTGLNTTDHSLHSGAQAIDPSWSHNNASDKVRMQYSLLDLVSLNGPRMEIFSLGKRFIDNFTRIGAIDKSA